MNFMFLLYSFYDPKPEMIPDDDDEWKPHFLPTLFLFGALAHDEKTYNMT